MIKRFFVVFLLLSTSSFASLFNPTKNGWYYFGYHDLTYYSSDNTLFQGYFDATSLAQAVGNVLLLGCTVQPFQFGGTFNNPTASVVCSLGANGYIDYELRYRKSCVEGESGVAGMNSTIASFDSQGRAVAADTLQLPQCDQGCVSSLPSQPTSNIFCSTYRDGTQARTIGAQIQVICSKLSGGIIHTGSVCNLTGQPNQIQNVPAINYNWVPDEPNGSELDEMSYYYENIQESSASTADYTANTANNTALTNTILTSTKNAQQAQHNVTTTQLQNLENVLNYVASLLEQVRDGINNQGSGGGGGGGVVVLGGGDYETDTTAGDGDGDLPGDSNSPGGPVLSDTNGNALNQSDLKAPLEDHQKINNLLGFQANTPVDSATCPTWDFSVFDQDYTLDSHCNLVENNKPILSAVMLVAWAMVALLIVLSA